MNIGHLYNHLYTFSISVYVFAMLIYCFVTFGTKLSLSIYLCMFI